MEGNRLPAATASAGPIPPDPRSEACERYFAGNRDLWRFIGFVSDLALRVDDMARIAADALPPGVSGRPVGMAAQAEGAMARGLRAQRHIFLPMVLARAVDNYMTYLTDLLSTLYRNSHEMPAGGESVRMELILAHDSIDDLIDALAEEKILNAGFRGVADIERYFGDGFAFALFVEDRVMGRISRIVDMRNLIVRRRGQVTRRFLDRRPDLPARLGQPLELTVDQVFADCTALAQSVADIDVRAADQFDLPRPVTTALPIG